MYRMACAVLAAMVLLGVGTNGASAADAAHFNLVNDSGERAQPRIVTFGQIFLADAVRPNTALHITLDGKAVPAQMDAKALYADGSVRHAVISIRAPEMASGASLAGVIDASPSPPAGATSPLGSAPPLTIDVTLKNGSTSRVVHIDLAELIRNATPSTAAPLWLKGPLASERRYYAPINKALEIDLDVRTTAIGPVRVDVIFHNDWAGAEAVETQTYGVTIRMGAKTVFERDSIKQDAYTNWHKVFWSDGNAAPSVDPDLNLLIEAGAVPRYDTTIEPDSGAINDIYQAAMKDADKLFSHGSVERYMPQTGGRPDIGPMPTWAVYELLDPTRKTRKLLFANADASGAVPWHLRERKSRHALTIDAYPHLWLDQRAAPTPDVLPKGFNTDDSDWTVDDAHQPCLTYLPYLLTGSQYYRDELSQQAAYNILRFNPAYRGDKGLLIDFQVRGYAWNMRSFANAAYILPANDPLRAYFDTLLKSNLNHVIKHYVDGTDYKSAGEVEGWFPGVYREEGAVAAWQDDYLAMVLDWINAMGYPDAGRTLGWMTNFIAGLFTNADKGYDPIYGTPYYIYVWDPKSGHNFDTWKEVFSKNFDPKKDPTTELDNPKWAGGYAALARGGLAAAFSAAHLPRAAEALAYVVQHTPKLASDYSNDPTFAIIPRMPDGSRISLDNFQIDSSANGNDRADLLVGTDDDDRLTGGAKGGILYGGDGDDLLTGGGGYNYLFGGNGNDTLVAGTGRTFMKGGTGTNTFEIKQGSNALIEILDFNPAKDRFQIAPSLISGGAASIAEDVAKATPSADGLIVTFGPQAKVAFDGKLDRTALAAAISATK